MAHRLGLILLLIASTVLLLRPVKGDEALFKQVCNWTPEQDDCLDCLFRYVHKDQTELAQTSVFCSLRQTELVRSDFGGISNATRDNAVKLAFEICYRILSDNTARLYLTNNDITDNRFSDAYDRAVEVSDNYSNCSEQIQNVPAPKPKTFSGDFRTLRNHYLNTEAILYKLTRDDNIIMKVMYYVTTITFF